MASAYGIIHDYGEPQSTFDAGLALQALQYKQQKYDANAIKIEQTLNQFGIQMNQLVRPEDREHLYQNVNKLVNSIQGLHGADLGKRGVTQGIIGHISQALDEQTITQLGNSAKIKNYFTSAEEYKEAGEGYSDTNFRFGLDQAGYYDYMNNKTDSLGTLNYTPFNNVQQVYQDRFDKMSQVEEGVTVNIPTGDGYFVKKTKKGLTEEEIRANVLNTLTPDQRKQLQINAWATYGQGDKEAAQAAYQPYLNTKVEKLESKITRLKLNYEGKTEAQKAEIDEEVALINSTIEYVKERRNDTQAIYSFLGMESLTEGLSSIYKPRVVSEEWSVDTTALKKLESQNKQIASGFGLDLNRNLRPDVTSYSIPTETEEDVIDLRKRTDEEFQQNKAVISTLYNNVYENLPQDKKKAFDTAYQSYLEENELEDDVLSRSGFLIQESNSGKGAYATAGQVADMKEARRQYKNQLLARKNAAEEIFKAKQNQVLDEGFISTLKNNPNIQILNEQGKVVSAATYLKNVTSPEQLTETQKKTLLQSVFSDITLSQTKNYDPSGVKGVYTTTNFNINRLAYVNGELEEELPMVINPNTIVYSAYNDSDYNNNFEYLKEEMQLPPQMTKEQFKKSIRPLMIFDMQRDSVRGNLAESVLGLPVTGLVAAQIMKFQESIPILSEIQETGEAIKTNLTTDLGLRSAGNVMIIGGEGTETRKNLEAALQNEIYDEFSFLDDSVEDDATLRSRLNYQEEFTREYSKAISTDLNFAQNKVVTVEPSGTRKGEEVPAYNDLIDIGVANNVDFNRGQGIKVVETPDGDSYVISQADIKIITKDDVEEAKKEDRTIVVPKINLAGTAFSAWVREDQARTSINVNNTKELYSDPITFADAKTDIDYLADINNMFFNGQMSQEDLAYLTNQGAKNFLRQKHSELYSNPEYGQLFENLIESAIDNSHVLKLKLEANGFGVYDMKIGYEKDGEFKAIESMKTGVSDITQTVGKFDVMQQEFYLQYLDRLLTDIENNGAKSSADQIKILTKLFAE